MSYVDGLSLLAGAVLFGLPGGLAYIGKWRRWTASPYGRAFPYVPFGLAWMGAGAALLGIFSVFSALGGVAAPIAAIVFGVPGIAAFCAGLAFALRTPRRFLPPWYRDFQHHAKRLR